MNKSITQDVQIDSQIKTIRNFLQSFMYSLH